MDPNIVILAAGLASRMKEPDRNAGLCDEHLASEVTSKPKAMIGLGEGGRPFLDYLLLNARDAGYRDAVLVIGENDPGTRDYYSSPAALSGFSGLNLSFIFQNIPEGRTKPPGTADALLRALSHRTDWKGRKVTVCNGDNLYSVRALRLLRESPGECSLIDYDWETLGFDASRAGQFAVIKRDRSGTVTRIIEKPSARERANAADAGGRIGVSMNIFRFSYDTIMPILEAVPLHPERQEKELAVAVMMLLERAPGSVKAIPLSEYVPDLTYARDVPKVQEFLRDNYSGPFRNFTIPKEVPR
jgi:NDP-sugar pyrophosphorylase family protein